MSGSPSLSLKSSRITSIDALRGLVMLIMALDHTRDFFTPTGYDPSNFFRYGTAIFLTRWITHLCAPVFIFLAGMSAALSLGSKNTKKDVAEFLFKRGLWLVVLELTVIRTAWYFNFDFGQTYLQVIWVIGWCMVLLSGLLFLPPRMLTALGILLVAGHNAFDWVKASDWGSLAWAWHFLHEPGTMANFAGHNLDVLYPVIPWVGVISLGYTFGLEWKKAPKQGAGMSFRIGSFCLIAFVLLRTLVPYGDPRPRATVALTPTQTFLDFINLEKYPPSLLYLLATLGISLLLLSLFERKPKFQLKPLIIFGSAPLFFYTAHIYLLHFLALGIARAQGFEVTNLDIINFLPPGFGMTLLQTFGIWIFVIASLYFPTKRFSEFKKRARSPFWRYC